MQLRHAEGVLAVEERGLVLVMSALRVAYAGGGDGEMALRADARNLAAFVRDPAAAVTAALLPFSLSAKYDTQVGITSRLGTLCPHGSRSNTSMDELSLIWSDD